MKKVFVLILSVILQSCVMHSKPGLEVKIINLSKNKVYVGELYECDSCGIMQDVRLFCSHGNDTTFFPQMLNVRDSTVMLTKLHYIQKIDVINADSLEEYCRKGYTYNIVNKSWVKTLFEKTNMANKVCRIIIK